MFQELFDNLLRKEGEFITFRTKTQQQLLNNRQTVPGYTVIRDQLQLIGWTCFVVFILMAY